MSVYDSCTYILYVQVCVCLCVCLCVRPYTALLSLQVSQHLTSDWFAKGQIYRPLISALTAIGCYIPHRDGPGIAWLNEGWTNTCRRTYARTHTVFGWSSVLDNWLEKLPAGLVLLSLWPCGHGK